MKLVVFGLSLSSSWGNGHATTYRSLLRAFANRGYDIVFYEWAAPWYGGVNRDLPDPDFARLVLYSDLEDVQSRAMADANDADATIVGSYVHRGAELIDSLTDADVRPLFFYDIDTPVTVATLRRGATDYIRPDQVPRFDRYLSFTGGPFLDHVVGSELGARGTGALYCSVDPDNYRRTPSDSEFDVDLAYMGTYAADRQPVVDRLLVEVAKRLPDRRFLVAGPQYPEELSWPANVRRVSHVEPRRHAAFYSSAAWQLNATRADMVEAGWSPSVRLFEAGAVGAAVISDRWPGIDALFAPGQEIELPETTEAAVTLIEEAEPEARRALGERLRERILTEHTSERRARELEDYLSASDDGAGGPSSHSRRDAVPVSLGGGGGT